jgi:hypothetical protein
VDRDGHRKEASKRRASAGSSATMPRGMGFAAIER